MLTLAAAPAAATAAAPRPLQTAIVDPDVFTGPDAATGLRRAKAAGVSAIKVPLFWNAIAPTKRPSSFQAADPSDPAYNWTQLDAQLRLIEARGLEPIVYVSSAPTWAMRTIDGFPRADPRQYAAFTRAAVRRYSGGTGLPRVRYWQAWNEPNKVPGRSAKAGAPTWYRELTNAFAASVHSVSGNAVVAGGLAPFGISTAVAPLTFMRSLLCLSTGPSPKATCSARVHFDIWSTDPYSAGGPTHEATRSGDVSIAELPQMKAVLDAGTRTGHIVSTQPVRFWVTEFSWDSNPPDPRGVPAALEGRWVAEALYRMWSAHVSLATWFTLRDQPARTSPYQSGLYYRGPSFARDRPKPALTAFRFPFVAYAHPSGISFWGRTPNGAGGKVVIEQHGASGWRRIAVLDADRSGIFSGKRDPGGNGPLRARLPAASAISLPFSLSEPPDRPYPPFGAQLAAPPTANAQRLAAAANQYVEVAPTAGGSAALQPVPAAAAAGPSSAVAAAAEAIAGADRGRSIALAGVMLATALVLTAAAIRRRSRSPTGAAWITATVGVGVFYVAYDDGGYSLTTRNAIAIAVWWAVLAGIGLGVWPAGRVTRGAIVPGALLALFAGWELASTAWASSAENAFAEFDRTTLYLGIYVLVVVAGSRHRLASWIDGLTVAITAIALVALVSRLFPGSFPSRGLAAALPSSSTRLSFPLDYWNGLGTFIGLGFPLLLRTALDGDRRRRLAAAGILPALGAAVYLTSSRGAAVALAGGVLVFVLAQPRRWVAFAIALAAVAGTAASIGVLLPRRALVDGPLGSAAARTEGWQSALLILAICLATAVLVEGAAVVAPRLPIPTLGVRRLCAAAIVTVAVAGAATEARSFADFTQLPARDASSTTSGHLLSGSGSGRWQFWTTALDEFRSAPLQGRGAGSFATWWAQHAPFRYFVEDAHSLFVQTLGELGVVGFLLLVAGLATGVAVGAWRLVRARSAERTAIAALLGSFTAYLIGAGVDWMWELTAVTLVGFCVLGLLTGPATLPPHETEPMTRRRARRRTTLVSALALATVALAVAEAVPLLAGIEVARSQAAVRAGDPAAARSHAAAATKLEPWGATPYLQLALVEQGSGELAAARRAIGESIRRDPADWRPWLVRSQIETGLGEDAGAARSLARARALNRLSVLP